MKSPISNYITKPLDFLYYKSVAYVFIQALWDLPWHYSDAKTISYMVYLLILCLHKENYAIS